MNRKIIFIMFLGLFIRIVAVFWAPGEFVFPDSVSYDTIATNILQGKGFVESEKFQTVRPPVYPLFLAFLYSFGANLFVVRILQCIVGTISIYFVYLISNRLFDDKVAILSSLLFVIDPFQVVFCSLVLTETLFTLLLLMCIWFVVLTKEENSINYAIVTGILFAIGSLLRSFLFPFLFFLSAIWFIHNKKQWRLICVVIATTFIAMSPWMIRNWHLHHSIIPTTTKTGINLYEGLGPDATGGPIITEIKFPEQYHKLNEIEQDKFLRKKALEHIRQHPQKFLTLAFEKMLRLWNIGFNYKDLQNHILNYAIIISSIFLYIFASIGIFLQPKKNFFYIVIPILYTCLIHMVFIGSVRYRVPILPFVDMLAALAILKLFYIFFKKN